MSRFRLDFKRHRVSGLWAATSADLEGLLVIAESFDELLEEVPSVAADLLSKKTGKTVRVEWFEAEGGDEFAPISQEVRVLETA